jgi:hypothetical protein
MVSNADAAFGKANYVPSKELFAVFMRNCQRINGLGENAGSG